MIDLLRSRTGKLLVCGHRGAKGYAPENTMAAFQKALETRTDVIEFDVHLSKDKQCVVIHDDLVDRTTDKQGPVRDFTWAELSKMDAGSWFDRQTRETMEAMENKTGQFANPAYIPPPLPDKSYAGTRMPLLQEVLEWAKAVRMPVSIEIKTPFPFYGGINPYPDIVERVLDLVARYGNEDCTHMHSFDHRAVLEVRRLNPRIGTGISTYGSIPVNPLGQVQDAQADGIAVGSLWVTPEVLEVYHAAGINVFAWGWGEDPYNEEKELAQLVQMGVDYVSGGFPDLLRKVVEKYV